MVTSVTHLFDVTGVQRSDGHLQNGLGLKRQPLLVVIAIRLVFRVWRPPSMRRV
jgi:hypothetical protein